mmetsp:Transcript_19312/g.31623  ORF Transcript_19312/g.31623 Transcript_19312/m.31623 type:complete len:724 (+) Transcript_19312:110-2281(+)|eukprot:CAMPEP_0184669712 /NCGR_PEP_ID=MMETSP0308-20130426/78699_1 /TAXON_ID=38269 /ORGANISM="Gloeochaete witrockiana, Strain SAG 46.84" /LENGTH=723 /DNA_ID=CAMNT_0027116125 /DNA_START=99 /DNA_END=2270 /DNA_ORIENTATION=-
MASQQKAVEMRKAAGVSIGSKESVFQPIQDIPGTQKSRLIPQGTSSSDVYISVGSQPVIWDYIMVWPLEEKDELKKKYRGGIIRRLRATGFIIKKILSRDKDEVFVKISAPQEKLEQMAEQMHLNKELKSGEGFAPFEVARRDEFLGSADGGLFRSVERQRIVLYSLTAKWRLGGTELDLRELLKKKIILKVFPLHEAKTRQRLIDTWAKKWFSPQPIDEIRDYFGEKIAIYFAFLGYYTNWLAIMAVLGLAAAIYQYATQVDNTLVPIYSVVLCLMVTLFLEGWKRKNSELAFKYDVMDYEEAEPPRLRFQGELRRGFYSRTGSFIPMEFSKRGTPLPEQPYYPKTERKLRVALGAAIIAMLIVCVVIAAVSVMAVKFYIMSIDKKMGWTGGVIMAIVIMVLNQFYQRVAFRLNEWENHRTETEHEDALILKVFLFQFVNSYISLFYTAFAMYPSYRAKDVFVFGVKQITCKGSCLSQLNVQLGSLFITNLVVGNIKELLLPMLISKINTWLEDRKMKKSTKKGEVIKKMSTPEEEAKLQFYESTFDDYSEMVIQFGYVTMFAAAFPLASTLALLNNVVEIRSDATKLLVATQRPFYMCAEDIGTWYKILEMLSFVSVLTNMAILVWTSDSLQSFFGLSLMEAIIAAIVVEHLLLGFKYVLSEVIPDIPGNIRAAIAKREFEKTQEDERAEIERRKLAGAVSIQIPAIAADYDSDHYEEDDS